MKLKEFVSKFPPEAVPFTSLIFDIIAILLYLTIGVVTGLHLYQSIKKHKEENQIKTLPQIYWGKAKILMPLSLILALILSSIYTQIIKTSGVAPVTLLTGATIAALTSNVTIVTIVSSIVSILVIGVALANLGFVGYFGFSKLIKVTKDKNGVVSIPTVLKEVAIILFPHIFFMGLVKVFLSQPGILVGTSEIPYQIGNLLSGGLVDLDGINTIAATLSDLRQLSAVKQ
ncbi:hypothetical protein [Mycoplasma sp. 1012]